MSILDDIDISINTGDDLTIKYELFDKLIRIASINNFKLMLKHESILRNKLSHTSRGFDLRHLEEFGYDNIVKLIENDIITESNDSSTKYNQITLSLFHNLIKVNSVNLQSAVSLIKNGVKSIKLEDYLAKDVKLTYTTIDNEKHYVKFELTKNDINEQYIISQLEVRNIKRQIYDYSTCVLISLTDEAYNELFNTYPIMQRYEEYMNEPRITHSLDELKNILNCNDY